MVKNDGKRLEAKFGAWLTETRGYEINLRKHVRGAVAVRPYEVDVAGTLRRAWASGLAFVGIVGCLVELVLMLWSHQRNPGDEGVFGVDGGSWFALEIALFAMSIGGLFLRREHVWAECKDMKNGIARHHVLKLRQSVGDVKKYGLGWQPRRVFLVTRNRFQEDALSLAHSFGFKCFQETADGFQMVRPSEPA